MPVSPHEALARELEALLGSETAGPPQIGVAVSGGGDSMALLHLAAEWARAHGAPLHVATVNHGLRPEAADEAAMVARACAALGVPHSTLHWHDWDGRGNVQAMARAARRSLLTAWADDLGLSAVLLGHTADDQAETVLMRLARGSGVDGLAGMSPWDKDRLFLRPFLTVGRADLRDWLRARGLTWVEDPSNDDTRYDRVKARQMLALLAPLGLTKDRLNDTAAHMLRARVTLRRAAAEWAARFVQTEGGDLILAPQALQLGESDTEARVFAAAVQWIGGAGYRPRYAALCDAAAALQAGEARTLGGVLMQPHGHKGARLMREASAVQGPVDGNLATGAVTIWDGRWQISQVQESVADAARPTPGPTPGHTSGPWQIAALGEAGIALCKGWREAGLPRASLLASPAIWADGSLLAAPVAGFAAGWQAKLGPTFESFILSH